MNKKRRTIYVFSLLFGAASILTIGLVIPPLFTIPLGLVTGIISVTKKEGRAGLVLTIVGLVLYVAFIAFWASVGQSFSDW